ncbi:response regulator [Brevibacillus reuszeri]|uniref:response regulator n=1 Tax=Brevibacillus reuszeri TaxID=54915 RepID=UPI000CCBF146|nr:response regulator [Brevibacillus reuszeri]
MKAILVDDEQLPLLHLQKVLERDIAGIEVIGAYSDPLLAIEMAKTLKPEVVFLDINMPGISGLEIGEQLQTFDAPPEIVFVTGYDKYAVEAFELCALDYIMKPVQLNRLQKTIERLRKRLKNEISVEAKPLITIKCFNYIQFQLQDQEPSTIKWRTAKARELFAYLLHHRNRMIDKDTIIELLWPECDLSKGVTQLYTTIYLIRQTLKQHGLESVSITKGNLENGYKLSVGPAQIDVEEWENHASQLSPPAIHNAQVYERILEMYTGDYLGEHEYLWAEHERERLRRLWLQLAKNLSSFYFEQEMTQAAEKVNLLMQSLHPLVEDSYIHLMKLYASTGNHAAVEEQYDLLAFRWEQELDTPVNPDITAWYRAWKQQPSSSPL